MDAVELRVEIEGDFLEILVIGTGFGGENFEEQPEYVMEPITSH